MCKRKRKLVKTIRNDLITESRLLLEVMQRPTVRIPETLAGMMLHAGRLLMGVSSTPNTRIDNLRKPVTEPRKMVRMIGRLSISVAG